MTAIVFLHGLGLSGRYWSAVDGLLPAGWRRLALDLPGFGAAADRPETTVEDTLRWLERTLATEGLGNDWILVGHSMGGKFATLLAAAAEDGRSVVLPPRGIVLVAASPPSPEPMDEAKREEMIRWFRDGRIARDDALSFIDANTAGPLPPDRQQLLVEDIQSCSASAWRAWLGRGSREDWSAAVSQLRTPALIVSGADDGPLGADSQRRLNVPMYRDTKERILDGCAHLIAFEQPEALAAAIADFVERRAVAALPAAVAAVIASDRVSQRTRQALIGRVPVPVIPQPVFEPQQRAMLDALVSRLLPQVAVDSLCIRIEAELAGDVDDGWRFAELPPDRSAWSMGLDTITALCPEFANVDHADQDRWITRLLAGEIEVLPQLFDGKQMQLWLQDVRRAALRAWLSHPAGLAEIGYAGYANGGDGFRLQGFQETRARGIGGGGDSQ